MPSIFVSENLAKVKKQGGIEGNLFLINKIQFQENRSNILSFIRSKLG